ncbi:F-box protein At4g00755-like [Phalaenopsis equestris]|uniref:F-box protein At4g00755-like n=1 Tax=Phalaenopsis equestris TaxID=78828 RepID=UPI0009E4E356|nr:F-box protein At4g00755-like [Phalaenopsis equestris]
MEICWDFMEWLGPDASSSVLILLDDPADLMRVSAVSRSWRRLVIANRFCRSLCFRICPEVSNLTRVVEACSALILEAGSSSCEEWKNLEREHRVYSYLGHSIASVIKKRDCIFKAIRASSTDNFPAERIDHTLVPSNQVDRRPSYWSSEGRSDPEVPETLTYRLCSKLCVVNEIIIQPFEAYFQPENPIYSAKAVRFRMGHSRIPLETSTGIECEVSAGDNYEWTYISPKFPMLQDNNFQSFKLPRPALCIGGILQIELLGRVQVQELDGLYYICICHVEARGHSLNPRLDVDFVGDGREMVLRWQLEDEDCSPEDDFSADDAEAQASSAWDFSVSELAWPLPILIGAAESDSDDELLL